MQCFSPYDSSVIEEEGLFFLAFSSLNILFSGRTIRVFFFCCCSFKLSQSLGIVCVHVDTCRLLQGGRLEKR